METSPLRKTRLASSVKKTRNLPLLLSRYVFPYSRSINRVFYEFSGQVRIVSSFVAPSYVSRNAWMERSRFEVSAEFLLLSFTRVREAAYALTRGDAGWRGKTAREPLIILLSFSLSLSLSSFFSCRQSDRDRASLHALFFDDRAYSRKVGIRLFRESGKTRPKNVSKGRERRGGSPLLSGSGS